MNPDSDISKHRLFLLSFCLLWVSFMIPAEIHAQTIVPDHDIYRSWYSGFSARSTAMANATVADPFGPGSLYSNPAALAFSENAPAIAIHNLYNSSRNVLLENITVSVSRSPYTHFAGAVTFQRPVIDQNPLLNPSQLQFRHFELMLGYAWLITSSLSAGVMLNSIYSQTAANDILTQNASLSILYAPSSLISYGLVYKGTGYRSGWLGAEPVYYLDNNQTVVSGIKAPHRLEMGVSLRFPSLAPHPDFVLSFSNEKIFEIDGLIYKGGIEIYLQKYLALRGGYFFSPFAEGARLGFGLILDSFNLNYAYAPTNIDLTGKSHQFSISLNF